MTTEQMTSEEVSPDIERQVPLAPGESKPRAPPIINLSPFINRGPSRSSQDTDQAPASSTQPIPVKYTATKAPKETLQAVYKAGQYKAGLPLNLLTLQCFMAGIYIAMAGHLFLAVGGGLLGASLFPTGLIAVVLTSAELFTGDALVFVASVLGQKVSFVKLLRNWTVAWIMNFAGCWSFFGVDNRGNLARCVCSVESLLVDR